MMKRIAPALLAIVSVTLVLASDEAFAQRPYRPSVYRPPAGPTITPYLDYFRRDTGATNRYHSFIQPGRRMRENSYRQDLMLRNLNTQVQRQQQAQRIAPSQLPPTGRGATFMNYSHYYQMRQGSAGQQQNRR